MLESLNNAHPIKMNTKNKREKIQGIILAKGFVDDSRHVKQERIHKTKKSTF